MNPESMLPPRIQRVLQVIVLSGLAGFVIPILLGLYVVARIQLQDQWAVEQDQLSTVLMIAIFCLLLIPISMVLAFVVAFIAGLFAPQSLWETFKESLGYAFAVPVWVIRSWYNSGM